MLNNSDLTGDNKINAVPAGAERSKSTLKPIKLIKL